MLSLRADRGRSSKRLSDILSIPWVKSSIYIGIGLAVGGCVLILLLKYFNIGSTQLFSDMEGFVAQYGLVGIFLATIAAGTLIPLGSPALVVAAAVFGVSKIPLILVATVGFTIGMIVNYALAYYLGRPYVAKKASEERLEELTQLWSRWGWILYTVFGLIPFLPVELLSFMCGLLRTRIDVFLTLSFLPRFIVFTILAYFGEYAGAWIKF